MEATGHHLPPTSPRTAHPQRSLERLMGASSPWKRGTLPHSHPPTLPHLLTREHTHFNTHTTLTSHVHAYPPLCMCTLPLHAHTPTSPTRTHARSFYTPTPVRVHARS